MKIRLIRAKYIVIELQIFRAQNPKVTQYLTLAKRLMHQIQNGNVQVIV